MNKLKVARCPECKSLIERHDPKRISIKVGEDSKGQGVFKEYHLKCWQSLNTVSG